MDQRIQLSKEKVISDLNAVVADAEELLSATTGQTGEKIAEIRSRMQEHLKQAKGSLSEAKGTLAAKARGAGHAVNDYARQNPWRAVGPAMGFGLVLGLLISRH